MPHSALQSCRPEGIWQMFENKKLVLFSCVLEHIIKLFPKISWRTEKFVESLDYQKDTSCCCVGFKSSGSNQLEWMYQFSVAAHILHPPLKIFVFTRHVPSIAIWLTTATLDVNRMLSQEFEYYFSYFQLCVTSYRHKSHKPFDSTRW